MGWNNADAMRDSFGRTPFRADDLIIHRTGTRWLAGEDKHARWFGKTVADRYYTQGATRLLLPRSSDRGLTNKTNNKKRIHTNV